MADDEGSGGKKARRVVRKRPVVKAKGGARRVRRSAPAESEGWERPTQEHPAQGSQDGGAVHGAGEGPVKRQVRMPKRMAPGDAEPPEVEAEDDLESREERLKDDYMEFARRYEDQMLYDQAIKYYRKAGAIPAIARVKDKMEDLYLDKARDFEAKGRYYEAAMLYRKMDNVLEAERLTAMARDHGEFTMDDVGKFDLAWGGGGVGAGPQGGGDEGAMFINMSSGEAVAAPPASPAATGEVDGDDMPREAPTVTPGPEEGRTDDSILDVTGRAGGGGVPGDGGRRVVELKRGSVDPATVGGEVKLHFSFCPYCGEKIGLPKPPLFCPYCGDGF